MTETVVRIPLARVGVLVGPEGRTKKEIEERSGVRLEVDSRTGEVRLEGSKAFEPVLLLKVRDVVTAVGRGFSPEDAFRLFEEESYLEILDVTEWVGKERKDLERVRARIIGTRGKTRKAIEEATGASLRIYGKTVSIVGDIFEVSLARQAVEMLLDGAPHSAVYKFLYRKKRELRLKELGL